MTASWVLIRGIVSEQFHWWDFLPHMRTSFPHQQIYTPDIPGSGKLHGISTPVKLADNLHALRQQVPPSGKKILLGFSLGGMLAIEWAYNHPEEVSAVVLINSSLSISPVLKRIQPWALANIAFSSIKTNPAAREEQILKMTTSNLGERTQEIAEAWGQRGTEYPTRTVNFFRQLALAPQAKMRSLPPPAPVLIIRSLRDRVVHPECSDKIAQSWQVPMISHPTAGHDLTLEDPHWVIEQIQGFISGQSVDNNLLR